MKLTRKKIIAITLISTGIMSGFIFIPWLLVKLFFTPIPATVPEQMEQILNYDIEGVIVHIDKKGEAAKSYAAGLANRDLGLEAQPDDLFKIASISKLYIAAATAKLVAAERLSLEDTLAQLLPFTRGKIANADKINLRMLIQHRSGIYNYVVHPDYPWEDLFDTNMEAIELIYGLEADFEPDADYAYSNTNYLLLGAIMDSVLGYSHHRYIDSAILQPLGLQHSYHLLSEVDSSQLMSGYHEGYSGDLKMTHHIHPGGSMIASAQDVAIFLRALNDGRLFSEEEQKAYVYEYEHTGYLPGYISMANYDKDLDAVVIIFMNTSGKLHWSYLRSTRRRIMKILKRDQ